MLLGMIGMVFYWQMKKKSAPGPGDGMEEALREVKSAVSQEPPTPGATVLQCVAFMRGMNVCGLGFRV